MGHNRRYSLGDRSRRVVSWQGVRRTNQPRGRVSIEPDLSLPGRREVFLIGDMSALTDVNGTQVPGLAAAAIQQGKAAAQNILRDLRGEKCLSFKYEDRGTMATIGHHRAVAEFGSKKFSGVTACSSGR